MRLWRDGRLDCATSIYRAHLGYGLLGNFRMNRISNEQREAIVRRAVAERDALLLPDAAPVPASAGTVPGWRPIETAPKDGTEFLGWRRGLACTAYRIPRDDCEMWFFGGQSGSVEHWPQVKPTHWMPLPPPPLEHQAEPAMSATDEQAGDQHRPPSQSTTDTPVSA